MAHLTKDNIYFTYFNFCSICFRDALFKLTVFIDHSYVNYYFPQNTFFYALNS